MSVFFVVIASFRGSVYSFRYIVNASLHCFLFRLCISCSLTLALENLILVCILSSIYVSPFYVFQHWVLLLMFCFQ